VFGDVARQVRVTYDEVNQIQLLFNTKGFTDALYQDDLKAQLLLTEVLLCQDQFWKEKARSQHFIQDNMNTFIGLQKLRLLLRISPWSQ